MDAISKALRRLSPKERKLVKRIISKVKTQALEGFDVKKLKGRKDIFRIRSGGLRIVYQMKDGGDVYILAVDRRSEKTYRFLA